MEASDLRVPSGLKQRLRTHHIRAEEQGGIKNGAAVVGLRREVDDYVRPLALQDVGQQSSVAYVPADETIAIAKPLLYVQQGRWIPGVGMEVVVDDSIS